MKERLLLALRPGFVPTLALALQLLIGFVPAATCRAQVQGPVPGQETGAAGLPTDTLAQVKALAGSYAAAPSGTRIEIEPGALDPRLRLAPCQRIEPYLPAGQRLWGRTRIGLRCTSGPVAWNVFLPVTVRVFGQAVVAATPLQAGAEITAQDLRVAEVDLAASPSPVFDKPTQLIGRKLATPMAPLATVRAENLRARQWFAAGDPVTVVGRGEGFSVSGEGQAMSPGIEGQTVRVRTEAGRIVVGEPVNERTVEVRL
jgi:flagella basal body P-ring formation protein FlgA